MTYGQFLLAFLAVPLTVLMLLLNLDFTRGRHRSRVPRAGHLFLLLAGLTLIAILYTAPWDNHLIATHVWSYAPRQVSGIALGVIPLEEVLFFPLQTLLVGLWFLWLAPRVSPRLNADMPTKLGAEKPAQRLVAAIVGGALWLLAVVMLLSGWRQGTYLGWELAWALPPILLQIYLGGDILWRYRRLLLAVILPVAACLSVADSFAIAQGIWTINPQLSLPVLLAGRLPLEELIFFTLTTILVAFGLSLALASVAQARYRDTLVSRMTNKAREPLDGH
jgi:lycopene beta-cyclase